MEETLQSLWDNLVALATNVGGKLIGAILTLVIGHFLIKFIMKAVRKSKAMQKTEVTVAHFLMNFLNIALNIVMIVTVIAILGVPMASVVAVIASAGVAVGLALQGSLSNLAGGIMILIFKPFKIGNLVETAGHSGIIEDIGIFYTVMRTLDNRQVTIPNGTVMASSVINVSAYDTRRVDFTFSVAYGTDVSRVNTILLEEAAKHELVLKDPEPFSRLAKQNESSLDFTLRVWAKSEDYWTVNFDLLKSINDRFVAENIEVPFNQLDVHVTTQN